MFCNQCGAKNEDKALFCAECGVSIARSGATTPSTPSAVSRTPPPSGSAILSGGTLFDGRYTIERLLGEGGMGRVYLAEDEKHSRRVALKVLKKELASDPGFAARFTREIKVCAKMVHPNVAMMLDGGVTEDGTPFLVMEYVEGKTLGQIIKENGPVAESQAVAWLSECCRALDAAHSLGLVHRDLKPDNIMISGAGSGSYVKVLDFGLGKVISGEDAERGSMALSVSGAFIGTPSYMSPEQASGDPADTRSDIYALGVVAYEMLTGKVPFDATTRQQMLMAHISKQPRSFSELNLQNVSVSPRLEVIVLRCLSKTPDERPSSAMELLKLLAEESEVVPQPKMGTAAGTFHEQLHGYQPPLDHEDAQIPRENIPVKKSMSGNNMRSVWIYRALLLLPMVVITILGWMINDSFMSYRIIENILFRASYVAIMSIGIAFVIMVGSIDLGQVGYLGFCSVIFAIVANHMPSNMWWLAAILSVLAGAIIGVINGVAVVYVRMPAYIATLGTMLITLGLHVFMSGGKWISINRNYFRENTFGVPNSIYVFILVGIIGHLLLSKSSVGRSILAIGINEEAARSSGIRVEWNKINTFIISGITVAIAAILHASRFGTVIMMDGNIGITADVITAAVIGGASINGGKSSSIGIFIGSTMLALINNILLLLDLSVFTLQMINGFILVLVVGIDITWKRFAARAKERDTTFIKG